MKKHFGFFEQNSEGNRKHKSYHSLISMDGKLTYPRFLLCKKPDKKTPIRREMTIFPIVENSDFLQNGKGETKAKCSKLADFLGKLRKAKKIGNTSRIIA